MEFGDGDKSSNSRCPKIGDFINKILPELEIMAIESEQSVTPGTFIVKLVVPPKLFNTVKRQNLRVQNLETAISRCLAYFE